VKKIILSSLLIFGHLLCSGQEGLFSQPFQSGILLNPALIGSSTIQTRIGGVYRTQWKVDDQPYENYGLYFESKVKEFKYGLLLNQSKTGDVGFKKTSILLASGLSKKLGRGNNKLSFGAQFGLYQMNVDYVKLQFDNQYNPELGYDSSLGTGEEFEATTLIQPDINIGLTADLELDAKLKIDGQIGLSIIHINTPGRTFNKEEVILPMQTIFHAKAFIHINDFWGIEPFFIFSSQDLNQDTRIGFNTGFELMDDNRLKFGIANDLGGVFTFLTQFEMKKIAIGFSIDANISKLNQTISDNNTFELSMIYNLPKKSSKTFSKDLLR
jgi:type IX secretion system PorP/SprF family membrane protein